MKFDPKLLKPGDNILVHSKGFSWISIAIRKLTESYWNHVAKYYEENGQGYVIEALFSGVVKRHIEVYLDPRKYDLKAVRLKLEAFASESEYIEGLEMARIRMYNKIGSKYDKWAIVYLCFKFVLKGFSKKGWQRIPKRFNPLQNREKFFCSEVVCESDWNISSLYPYLYMGKVRQNCSTTTPKDTGKNNVDFVTGKDVL